jgi:MoaA/NifB/PqqE/SkfB family radical SAM enzyme
MSNVPWKLQSIEGGLLAFDRTHGLNCLVRNEATLAECRKAPRSLQIGLLTSCNLACNFCYRDIHAPSKLTADFLLDLLVKAAKWSVLEISFGGGEPLLFKGFVPLLRQLHERTTLGLNFTTNGTLLTPKILSEIGESVGEIRVSAYQDNHYRRTLRILANRKNGLNLLVKPQNVGLLELLVTDALRQGARNVLLLGYKGSDSSLHLSVPDIERLRLVVLRMQHLPIRLDICWYPLLSDLPHLFARPDCGAGDEFLVITPDKAIQPCSFHHERIPFDTFDDSQRIYRDLKERRPAAYVGGCSREQFVTLPTPATVPTTGMWLWQAHASNNSGDWTIVGKFRSAELAKQAAEALRVLSRAHEAFLASPEGHAWIEANEYYGGRPTPPLQKFGEAHGFEWSGDDQGLWWEEDGGGAPVLTAGAVGDTVVVYHEYCMGLPEEPFRKYFAAVGATGFASFDCNRPSIIATAKGNMDVAVHAIREYLALVDAAEYPSDVEEPPPWGAKCDDPRVLDDENRSATLASGPQSIQTTVESVRLLLTFENTFAGALALERWLHEQGFAEVVVQVEHVLEPLNPGLQNQTTPKADLFPNVRLDGPRFSDMNSQELVRAYFKYQVKVPAPLEEAVQRIPVEERLLLGKQVWKDLRRPGLDVDWRALELMRECGPAAATWLRELVPLLLKENYYAMGIAFRAMATVLPKEESFPLALIWLRESKDREEFTKRIQSFFALENPGTAGLIEEWWLAAEPSAPVTSFWGPLAANSHIDWGTLRRWIETGRPLSLIALEALVVYSRKGLSPGYGSPTRSEFESVLKACLTLDTAPRVEKIVSSLLAVSDKLSR